jgi:hypothetical protein
MALLRFARELMLGQPTAAILEPLGGILSVLWTCFSDIDIRDHARFYYVLLTHISGEQLSFILENNFESVARINDIMTDNLRLSSAVQLARGLQPVAEPFLGFRRATVTGAPPTLAVGPLAPVSADPAIVTAYLEDLCKRELELYARVNLVFGFTKLPRSTGDVPESVYAVTVSFGHNPRQEPIAPIELVVVDAAEHALASDDREGGGLAVVLQLRPIDPIPTVLETTVEYSFINGEAFAGPLQQLDIGFRDMLIPLPIAGVDGTGPTVETMFAALWAHFHGVAEQSGGGGDGGGVVESVLHVPALSLEQLHAKLGDLVVRVVGESTGEGLQFEAGALLLPRTHVLLRGVNVDGTCTIRVITEAHRAIPFLLAHLKS